MAYITTTDLSARLGGTIYARLTDRTNGTTADGTVAQQIVDEAQAEADSYLSRRYATPVDLTAHPELANVLALRTLDLAEYAAWKGSPFVNELPSRVKLLYEQARRWFEDVSSAEIDLPASGLLPSRVAEDDSPRYSAAARPLTAEELDGL